MTEHAFKIGDIVEFRKKHPCGGNQWEITRMGMDIRVKCLRCDHSLLIPRSKFVRNLKRVLSDIQLQSHIPVHELEMDARVQITHSTTQWPSTAANESNKQARSESELKEISELRELGYQITGRDREMRWRILVNTAIPKLGLKTVTYTIANHIRTRKAQVGGARKYAYAIAEWEYDLLRLKELFDENSNFPST